MRFALQRRAHFSSLIRPHGPAPAALASLLSHPPDPQIIRKTLFRDFPQNPRTRLLSSDSLSLSLSLFSSSTLLSLTLPTSSHAQARQARASPCAQAHALQATPKRRAQAHMPKSSTVRGSQCAQAPMPRPSHAYGHAQARHASTPKLRPLRAQPTPTLGRGAQAHVPKLCTPKPRLLRRAQSCARPFLLRVNRKETVWGNNRALNCKSCKTFQAHPCAPNSLLNMGLESHGTTMWSNTRTRQGRKFQARHCPYVQNRI